MMETEEWLLSSTSLEISENLNINKYFPIVNIVNLTHINYTLILNVYNFQHAKIDGFT